MRVLFLICYLVPLPLAPLAAADVRPCMHDNAAADVMGTDVMASAHEAGGHHGTNDKPGSACQCDPGCAAHCDGATSLALVLSAVVAHDGTACGFGAAPMPARHADPPRAAPLRPPQTPKR